MKIASELHNNAKRILYIQYTNPAGYPPLEHSSRILANAGWEVLFLGTGSLGADALRFPSHERITVRQLSFCSAGWRQKLHYAWFALWVLAWTLRWRPQWIYASDPLSCPVALFLSYFPGFRIIYHEHDSPNSVDSKFMQFVLWARRHLARRAQPCVLPNEQRAKIFKETTGGNRVITVWNCPGRDEVGPRKGPNTDAKLRLYYHGNIGPSYLPPSVLKAMTMLPSEVYLRVIGYETISTRGYKNYLKEEAERLGIRNRVKFLGPMPRYQLLKQSSICDVGLAFIPRNDRNLNNLCMTGASNKPFDYLAYGLALLVSDLPDWRKMYVEPGYGLACDPADPESIATALRWFLEHPAEMREMGERGRRRIVEEWNYETQFAPVLNHLCHL